MTPNNIVDGLGAKNERSVDGRDDVLAISSSPSSGEGGVTRPPWDEYFLSIAKAVAARADCRRVQHGCVITKENRIVSTGYNGGPAGGLSCLAGDCPRGRLSDAECRSLSSYENCVALHAEQNAIAYADGSDTRGATLYVTGPQCDMCAKLAQAAGIIRVVIP